MKEGYSFTQKGFIFDRYIDPIYKWKIQGGHNRAVSKSLLNSLYGILGFKGEGKTINIQASTQKYIKEEYKVQPEVIKEQEEAEVLKEQEEGEVEPYRLNVAIAAAITSYARIYMYDFRINSIYHDTDSVILREKLPESMVSATELGKFKLEHEIEYGIFAMSKCYSFKKIDGTTKTASAGIPVDNVEYEHLVKYLQTGEGREYSYSNLKSDIRALDIRRVEEKRGLSRLSDARVRIYLVTEDPLTKVTTKR